MIPGFVRERVPFCQSGRTPGVLCCELLGSAQVSRQLSSPRACTRASPTMKLEHLKPDILVHSIQTDANARTASAESPRAGQTMGNPQELGA